MARSSSNVNAVALWIASIIEGRAGFLLLEIVQTDRRLLVLMQDEVVVLPHGEQTILV